MATLLITLGFAFIVVVLALALLGIGRLITGKSRIEAGACGRAPKDKRSKSCGTETTCSLCKKDESKKDEEKK